MTILARVSFLVAVAFALVACARSTRRTLTPDIPKTGDAEARSRFTEARAKFLRDGSGGDEFKRIAEGFPDDPIVPWAQLYAGISAIKDRNFDAAAASLGGVIAANTNPGLTVRAELFLGITKNYQGDPAGALALLARTENAIENDQERTEYLGAIAYASTTSDQPLASLRWFDQLYSRVTPAERALIVARVQEVVASGDPDALGRIFDEVDDRKGPTMAAIASRLALLADAAGNASEAARLREVAAPARAAVGLPRAIGAAAAGTVTGTGDARLVGAIVPLGGKQHRVAEAAVAGLGIAAGVGGSDGVTAVEVRAASDADGAAVAVEDLARANVIAIIGPMDSGAVDASGARAESLGVPLLSLTTAAEKARPGRYVFHMIHSGEGRSRALARSALARGVKKFAVLAAENGYGKAMTAAFVDEVGKGGGQIVTSVGYKPDTVSFAGITGKLDGAWDAVFVPAQAETLGLIAPALAASGKVPKPLGTKKVVGGRPIFLLSTAEALTGAYLMNAGRHSEGALFAPGYYPDDQDPAGKLFLDRFVATFGRAPGFIEAYAHDAAQLAASAGSGGRSGLAASLARGQLAGLTGMIQFDQDHRRADSGVLYTVVEETPGAFAIRIAR